MDKVQLVVLIVVACCTFGPSAQWNMFQTTCPMGCLDKTCNIWLGCTGSCWDGWCKFYGTNVGWICTPECSRGQSCRYGYCMRD